MVDVLVLSMPMPSRNVAAVVPATVATDLSYRSAGPLIFASSLATVRVALRFAE